MLIIEIALGIVLAVIILVFWHEIIRFGLLGALILAALSAVAFGSYYAYENFSSIAPLLSIMVFIIILIFFVKYVDVLMRKISIITLNKWNLTSGEIFGNTFVAFLILAGLTSAAYSLFTSNYGSVSMSLGIASIVIGLIGYKVQIKDIKKSREHRAITESYEN